MARVLGVIVPCRNEAAVIARKLRNLSRCAWPASGSVHRIVVVDDGSTDETAARAREELAKFDSERVRVEVLVNTVRPGKSGAIETGLRALGDTVELVVLTDADVVIAPHALIELTRAFECRPSLGMATGAQTFVESLASDGTLLAEDGGELRKANTLYDAATARVRAVESRAGLVFSVHGQLLAWRNELALVPTPGIAADDLDLMLQARVRGLRVEWARAARFFEVRAPLGVERTAQSQRRARAYVQFLRHPRIGELTHRGSPLARSQAWCYLHAHALYSFAVGATVLVPLLVLRFGIGWGFLALVAWGALLRAITKGGSPLGWIELAKVQEDRATMEDRWETARR